MKLEELSPEVQEELRKQAAADATAKLAAAQAEVARLAEVANKVTATEQAAKEAADKLAAATAEAEKLRADLDKAKAVKPDGSIDMDAVLTTVQNKLGKEMTDKLAESQKQVEEMKAKLHAAELERLRNRLVQEAGGEDQLVAELVGGNDEASLRASIAQAVAAFKRIKDKAAEVTAATARTAPGAVPLFAASEGGGKGAENWTAEEIRQLSPAEYRAAREKLRAAALRTLQGPQ